jgi:hypothetical protein
VSGELHAPVASPPEKRRLAPVRYEAGLAPEQGERRRKEKRTRTATLRPSSPYTAPTPTLLSTATILFGGSTCFSEKRVLQNFVLNRGVTTYRAWHTRWSKPPRRAAAEQRSLSTWREESHCPARHRLSSLNRSAVSWPSCSVYTLGIPAMRHAGVLSLRITPVENWKEKARLNCILVRFETVVATFVFKYFSLITTEFPLCACPFFQPELINCFCTVKRARYQTALFLVHHVMKTCMERRYSPRIFDLAMRSRPAWDKRLNDPQRGMSLLLADSGVRPTSCRVPVSECLVLSVRYSITEKKNTKSNPVTGRAGL